MQSTPNTRLRRLSLTAFIAVLICIAIIAALAYLGPHATEVFHGATLTDCIQDGQFVACPTP